MFIGPLIFFLFVHVCYLRFAGVAALQKYIGSLSGIGMPGVGASSSFSGKEQNKEFMPENVRRPAHDNVHFA